MKQICVTLLLNDTIDVAITAYGKRGLHDQPDGKNIPDHKMCSTSNEKCIIVLWTVPIC